MAQITYTVLGEDEADFKTGFLKSTPVPLDDNGNPIMSQMDWIKEWGKIQFLNAYRLGKKKIARETTSAVINEDVIS